MRRAGAPATLSASTVRRLLLSALSLLLAAPAAAQTFREVAEEASEVPGSLRYFARALFERCEEAADPSAQRRCERQRRRDGRVLRSTLWLASMPAGGKVEVGPYETVREGFLVRVPQLVLEANGGLLTTRDPTDGANDPGVLAERFFVVPPERAERWFRRNALERVRLRLLFRIGRLWRDGDRRGALIEVVGVQAYNASTGTVLVDSFAPEDPPPGGPVELTARVTLWEPTQLREARWRGPDSTPLILSVRVERDDGGIRHPVLVQTLGVARQDLARFDVPADQDASLALAPHGPGRLLAIFTDRRPSDAAPGHGVVQLYGWRDGALVPIARWEGRDDEAPRWVVDPAHLP